MYFDKTGWYFGAVQLRTWHPLYGYRYIDVHEHPPISERFKDNIKWLKKTFETDEVKCGFRKLSEIRGDNVVHLLESKPPITS